MERQYGEHPSGYQLFTKGGHMIFISVADNRKPPSQTVLIHIDTHTVPPFPETVDRTYTMEINGNKLTLTADPFVAGTTGQRIISIRTFERAE
jgi:hypothetical protein